MLKVTGAAIAGAVAAPLLPRSLRAQGTSNTTIERDVCVVGGGSSGTYMAVRLGDYGKSVVLLEQTNHLGGHAETYIVQTPVGPVPINIGVEEFETTPVVLNYLNRFGLSTTSSTLSASNGNYVDLSTGHAFAYTPPTEAAIGQALGTYLEILATKYPYLDSGFDLPSPVPQELLEPFGTFVTTYGLQALVPTIFDYNQGQGNLLEEPTLYVLKLFSLTVVNAIINNGLISIVGGTAQLYAAATKYLGTNVIFNANLCSIDRSGPQIKVVTSTPTGTVTIVCNKLVWSAPPTLFNMATVDLDISEIAVFGQLQSKGYAVGLAAISGLPEGISILNMSPNNPYNLPSLPGLYFLIATVPGLYLTLVGANNPLPTAAFEILIASQVAAMAKAGTYPAKFEGFEIFSNHTPFQLGVSAKAIAGGFYTRMNALQGHHHTYYNSAAFQTNDSALIWQFTEELLPQVIS